MLTEEVLLEALCFDFVIRSPHIDLIDLLEAGQESSEFEEYAFTIANDSSVHFPGVTVNTPDALPTR